MYPYDDPYEEEQPTTAFPPPPPPPPRRRIGRSGRIAVAVVAAVLLAAAGVGIAMSLTDSGGSAHDADGAASAMDVVSGHPSGTAASADPSRQAWARQYGQAFSSMPNLPDVGSATPEQRAAAADLLARTEAGVRKYMDPAAAKAAGYDLDASLARTEQRRPHLAQAMQAVDAGQTPKRMPMLHVVNKANLRDGKVLDPDAPEVLMYEYQGHNAWKVVGVMYTANEAYPAAPPDPGGPITRWHYHDNVRGGQALMMHIFFVPDNDLAHAYALKMDGM
jgi:hypothetical protein